jgi:hypothetical protein
MVRTDKNLLLTVVTKHLPELHPVVQEVGIKGLSADQRSALREAITSEFIETGLMPNDEPNARGLALEELLDEIGF